MHSLTSKRVEKFARDFGFEGGIERHFELYVAATYLYRYVKNDAQTIQDVVLGGGNDEGVDIAAVVVNGQVVNEPSEIDDLIAGQEANSARVVMMQAKTSESFDSKLIAKFLHGVESVTRYAMKPGCLELPPRLVDLAALIERVAENGDKFHDTKIPCDLYYVTTSSRNGDDAAQELQVQEALERIRRIGVYHDEMRFRTQGYEELASKQKERLGPQKIQFNFEKRQTIPVAEGIEEAYIGLISANELLGLLMDDNDVRPGIFDDNVRLHLGVENPVNRRITETLQSGSRGQFPFLNNGVTLIATQLQGTGDRFFISGYQVVNGGQTSHQLMRWADSEQVREQPDLLANLWVPIKVISSGDAEVRSRVAVATNLQTPIANVDIQASSQIAKDVEEYFLQSGADGLRYERQERGQALDFARTRIVGTSELNRAVAATVFGESSRAIGSPKDFESEDSIVWGDYPVEMYYYAAWIIYRTERYFARTPEKSVLKAAKYHIAMMVSAMVNPQLVQIFGSEDSRSRRDLTRLKIFKGVEAAGDLQTRIEDAIPVAAEAVERTYEGILSTGRSLRKDDVRSRRSQEMLLISAQELAEGTA